MSWYSVMPLQVVRVPAQVLAVPLLIQLLADALGKAADEPSEFRHSCGKPEGVSTFCLSWSSLA